VRRTGKSYAHPFAVLITDRNGLGRLRVGITAGRSVGNAVQRNKAKRQLRENLRPYLKHMEPGWDIILIARSPIIDADWLELSAAVQKLLKRANLITGSK
jgi:ribonuclease P protein component